MEFLEENKILENTELRKRLFTRSKRLERKTVGNVFTSNFEEIKGIFGNIDKVNDVDLKILLKKAFINTSDFEKSKMFIEKGIALQNGLPKGGKLNIFQYVGAGKDKLMSAEKFGAFVGKNMGRTYEIEKLHTFMEFVDKAKKANKINNIDVFMNNSLSHRSVIEKS